MREHKRQIIIKKLPKTINGLRGNRYKQATETKSFRAASFSAVKDLLDQEAAASEEQRDEDRGPAPYKEPVFIVAKVTRRSRHRRDVGAAIIAVKAAVDGLVDGGLLIEDDDRYVRGLCFLPDEIGSDADRLILEIFPAEDFHHPA